MEEDQAEFVSPKPITLYTEVSPQRAENLLHGNTAMPGEGTSNITRWISEIILQDTLPKELKALGISREQTVWSTPIPFQGASPIEGKVFLAFETNPSLVHVAEGDHLTQMRQAGVIDIGAYMQLQKMIGKSTGVTNAEVLSHYNSLPQQTRNTITEGILPLARNYWKSVVPYNKYIKFPQPYIEPEALLLPQAPISNIKKVGLSLKEDNISSE